MKTLLRFLTLSCLVTLCGYTADAATGDQVVKMDAVRYMLNNNAPAQMDKEKFLDKLCSADVVNVRELLIACTASLPDNIACDECKKFITGIIDHHNKSLQGTVSTTPSVVVAAPVAPTTPGTENPSGNASGTPTTPGAQNPNGATPATPTTPGAQNPNGATPATPTTPGAQNPNGAIPATPTTPGAQNPNGNTPATVTPGTPVTFKSVCENDGGTYSTGKHTYNMADYDGEWCGGNKTACVKLFTGTGISVRGVTDNAGKIYCFVGTAKEPDFVAGPSGGKAPAKPQSCKTWYNANTFKSGGTYKVDCSVKEGTKIMENKECNCACDSGVWKNCVETPGQKPTVKGGIDIDKPGKSKTSDKNTGKWTVTFDYGTVSGISKCEISAEEKKTYPDGGYCKCQVTSLPGKTGPFPWFYNRFERGCNNFCAAYCARIIQENKIDRQDAYGK